MGYIVILAILAKGNFFLVWCIGVVFGAWHVDDAFVGNHTLALKEQGLLCEDMFSGFARRSIATEMYDLTSICYNTPTVFTMYH